MRVQIHLNLGQPQLAENVVRVQSPSGAWIGVAYATQLILHDVVPHVDKTVQQSVADGLQKKIPHAFLEGKLLHFVGRMRERAPTNLILDRPRQDGFVNRVLQAQHAGIEINYNPRVATCFYQAADTPTEKFIQCDSLVVSGWNFYALGAQLQPLAGHEYVNKRAGTSAFEKLAVARGRKTSEGLLSDIQLTRRSKLG